MNNIEKDQKSFSTKSTIIAAFLGIILGMLLLSSINSFFGYKTKYIRKIEASRWAKINLILREIDANYVDTVDVSDLTDVAVEALLSKLDPHSVYLPPKELERTETELSGKFYGIGIQFNVPQDTAIVLDVIAGGPSQKLGLQRGDKIIKVDDRDIAGVKMPQDSMVYFMKGEENTHVKILVQRGKDIIPFDITRGKIPLHSVEIAYMLNDSTAYLKLSKFNMTTYDEVKEATSSLSKLGMKKLIMDLRANSGGYLGQALMLSNMFLKRGCPIVELKGKSRKPELYKADGTGNLQNIELVVLIDENSASSSEIFAGAMQDNDRALIVGRRSFGKGLVQEPINFSDGSGIRLTVARFYTPSGRSIQKPYSSDYRYELYKRYTDGEMFNKDSIRIDSLNSYKTLLKSRTVYGGGGIIPDIYVPIDTTLVLPFYRKVNSRAIPLRFAAYLFEKYKDKLSKIDNYSSLESFYNTINIDKLYLNYIRERDGIAVKLSDWNKSKYYILVQVKALIARYSAMGEEGFYKAFEPIDKELQIAIKSKPLTE